MISFRRIAIFEPELIIGLSEGRQFGRKQERQCLEWAGRCLERGADCFLLRVPVGEVDWAEEILFTVMRISDKRNIPLILNMPDLDREVKCAGFHFKDRQAMAPPFNRRNVLYGKSVHTRKDAQIAEAFGFDYLFFSPVFKTESHPYADPQGIEGLSHVCSGTRIPIFALGGIHPQNIDACLSAGAHGIAAIRMWL